MPTLDQQNTATIVNELYLRPSVGTQERLGQPVVPSVSGLRTLVKLHLKRVGTVSGNVWITIESDSGGLPSGTVLATSSNVVCSSIATSAADVDFNFPTPANLIQSTKYHYVLRGDYSFDGSNNIRWQVSDSSGYAGDNAETYNGSSWSEITNDGLFKDYWDPAVVESERAGKLIGSDLSASERAARIIGGQLPSERLARVVGKLGVAQERSAKVKGILRWEKEAQPSIGVWVKEEEPRRW